MFANLIFDWSGTLVDDFHPTLHATNVVFERHAKPVMTADEFRENFRLPYPDFYEEYLPGHELESLEELFKEAFLTAEEGVRPLEPTMAFLAFARRQGMRMFVLTSMNTEAFERQARAFGILEFFEATYSGVLDKRGEIRRILQTHGLDAHETAYVGDMVHDVEAAHDGGVMSVAVLSGYDPPGRLAAANPSVILKDVSHLVPLLEKGCRWEIREDIVIRGLRARTRIGVPAEERATTQDVLLTVAMETKGGIAGLGDEFGRTVDYFAVSERLRELAASGERLLIETLAEDLGMMVKAEFSVRRVRVKVDKFVLRDCEAVSVEVVL